MELHGRELVAGMRGNDVRRLHAELSQLGFAMPLVEVGGQLFGEVTLGAVQKFQQRQGLPQTGVVDAETARRINVATAERAEAVVQGMVRFANGDPAPDVVVRAYRRGLRGQDRVGEAVTDQHGVYRIAYPARPQPAVGQRSANPALIVRAVSELGVRLATSAPLFNPPAEATVDLEVRRQDGAELSEYEVLLAALAPEVESMPLAELDQEQLALLAGSTGADPGQVKTLVEAVRLAQDTGLLSPAVFYGLARLQLPTDLDALLARNPGQVTNALGRAINEGVIPARVNANRDGILARLDQLRLERGVTEARTARGRLLDDQTGAPLAGCSLRVLPPAGDGDPDDVDATTTGADGRFAFVYLARRVAPGTVEPERRFLLRISRPPDAEVHQVELLIRPGGGPVDVAVPLAAAPPSPGLAEVAEQLDLELPQDLVPRLAERGIRTLEDLRRAGGLAHLEGLPAPTGGVQALEAHARLSALPTSLAANARLIDAGYAAPEPIGAASRVDFVNRASQALGDFGAARLQAQAKALTQLLDNAIVDTRVVAWDPFPAAAASPEEQADQELADDLVDLFPSACACRACGSAISPLAYLADLLAYAVQNVRRLPDGAGTGTPVSLRELAARFHQPLGDLPAACVQLERRVCQVRICVEVLRRFLAASGLPTPGSSAETLLDEALGRYLERAYAALLTANGTSLAELRLARGADAAARRALAERLGLGAEHLDRLDALTLGPETLDEQALERLFGLVDTTRDPLALAATPELLAWRRERAREQWGQQDTLRGAPIIDPDLIDPAYLKHITAGAAAFTVWQARSEEIGQQVGALEAARAAAASDLAWLDAAVEGVLGVTAAALLDLAAQRAAGGKIDDDLAALHLTAEAFDRLLAVRRLAQAGRILDGEAEDAVNILVQAHKRSRAPTWRQEERDQGITLGPDHFVIPPAIVSFPPPAPRPLPPWRASHAALRDWRASLQARIDQEQALKDALDAAVAAAEGQALPGLRDALVAATGRSAAELTLELGIDCEAGGGQETTRIAQAIETVQGLLWALHTRQLTAAHPDLELSGDDFDTAWTWLGSYETWRAAMLVFLYPENVLWPSLRPQQTPAFQQLLARTRAEPELTPEQARELARDYEQYFRAVVSLEVEATCSVRARRRAGDPSSRDLLFMFARSGETRRAYWSAHDPRNRTGYAQSFWSQVPGLEDIDQIVGATSYRTGGGDRFVYLFATTEREGSRRLLYTRLNLEGWSDGWDDDPTPVQIGDDAAEFSKVVVKQTKTDREPPELAIELPTANGLRQILHGVPRSATAQEVAFFDMYDVTTEPSDVRLLAATSWGDGGVLLLLLHSDSHLMAASRVPVTGGLTAPDVVGIAEVGRAGEPRAFESWRGAICWPGQINLVYAFWDDGDQLRYAAIWGDRRLPGELRAFTPTFLGRQDRLVPNSTDNAAGDDSGLPVAYQRANGDRGPFRAFLRRTAAAGLAFSVRPPAEAATPTLPPLTLPALRMDNGYRPPRDDGQVVVDEPPVPPKDPPDPPPPDPLKLDAVEQVRIAPLVEQPLPIVAPLTESQALLRRVVMAATFDHNPDMPASHRTYLEEAYFFVPVQLALQLQRSNAFTAALDWFRTVLDYGMPPQRRKLYYGLRLEESLAAVYDRADEWLLDPLTPHAIASVRRNAYTRFTVLALVRCLLGAADREFTRDTAESVARARVLYTTALDLLGPAPQPRQACATLLVPLDAEIGAHIDRADPGWHGVWNRLRQSLEELDEPATLHATIDQVRAVWAAGGPIAQRLVAATGVVERAHAEAPAPANLATVLEERRSTTVRAHELLQRRTALVTAQTRLTTQVGDDLRDAVATISGVGPEQLDADPTVTLPWLRQHPLVLPTEHLPDGGGGVPAVPPLEERLATLAPLQLLSSLRTFDGRPLVPGAGYRFCVPANPVPEALRQHAGLSLYKLRTGRNVAGDQRQLEPYAAPVDLSDVVGGATLPLRPITFVPTPYRYAVLIERAKQLVGLAQQMEAAFLSALEKRDAEAYNLLKASQDIELARAGIRLQDLRLREAQHGVTLAELQLDRAFVQLDHYQGLLDEGVSDLEIAGTIAGMAAAAGGPLAGAGHVGLAVGDAALGAAGALLGPLASFERRRQEWELARALAQQDLNIAGAQVTLANDQVRVVSQERMIAAMQAEHAAATAEFLAGKFTNFELYDWMSAVLEGTYRYFLQQATAVAQLATGQLAFERQQALPPVIQSDYWEAPSDLSGGGNAPDRRGLTGSARLLQDLFQLDQYAFETDRRKQQLTKTISLAQLAPAEFQRFRERGVLPFNTPMELFDRDFPGHYLRLIKRVRVSLIALIPPTEGIKATLSTTGFSRAVIESAGIFATVRVRRPPETLALTSPRDATGLFELTPQPQEMLLPFEGLGVDTGWVFELPKPANLFDYATIADMLFTVEYTALESGAYRQQVIQGLGNTVRFDRPFSFRQQFADQWYDLHNPDQTSTPLTVHFPTVREDFAPNLDRLRIEHVLLYFSRRPGETFEVEVAGLRFTEHGAADAVGGPATSIEGLISTRRGNADAWTPMIGKLPIGEWELALPDTPQTRALFAHESIEEILLVLTYAAQTHEWPHDGNG